MRHGYTGDVDMMPSDLGLGNVDNTSDINKPVSTAQQAAIDLKMNQHNAAVDPHPQYTTPAEASAAPIQTVNGLTGNVVLTTGNVAEVGNLYYTDPRVQTYITGAGYNVKSLASVGAGASVYQANTAGAFVDAGQAAAITALTTVTTPDATDEATAITLVNAFKVKVDQIIATLKA